MLQKDHSSKLNSFMRSMIDQQDDNQNEYEYSRAGKKSDIKLSSNASKLSKNSINEKQIYVKKTQQVEEQKVNTSQGFPKIDLQEG